MPTNDELGWLPGLTYSRSETFRLRPVEASVPATCSFAPGVPVPRPTLPAAPSVAPDPEKFQGVAVGATFSANVATGEAEINCLPASGVKEPDPAGNRTWISRYRGADPNALLPKSSNAVNRPPCTVTEEALSNGPTCRPAVG